GGAAVRWVGTPRAARLRFGDEPRAAAVGREAERPANEDDHGFLEADQIPEVNDQPRQPGDEAAQAQASDFGHGRCAPDRGEVALVVVAEGYGVLRAQSLDDHPCRIASL